MYSSDPYEAECAPCAPTSYAPQYRRSSQYASADSWDTAPQSYVTADPYYESEVVPYRSTASYQPTSAYPPGYQPGPSYRTASGYQPAANYQQPPSYRTAATSTPSYQPAARYQPTASYQPAASTYQPAASYQPAPSYRPVAYRQPVDYGAPAAYQQPASYASYPAAGYPAQPSAYSAQQPMSYESPLVAARQRPYPLQRSVAPGLDGVPVRRYIGHTIVHRDGAEPQVYEQDPNAGRYPHGAYQSEYPPMPQRVPPSYPSSYGAPQGYSAYPHDSGALSIYQPPVHTAQPSYTPVLHTAAPSTYYNPAHNYPAAPSAQPAPAHAAPASHHNPHPFAITHPISYAEHDDDSDSVASAHPEDVDAHNAAKGLPPSHVLAAQAAQHPAAHYPAAHHPAAPAHPAITAPPQPNAPQSGVDSQIPVKIYGLPQELWDGLHMNGKFVAQSPVGPIALIFSAPHDGKMKSTEPQRKTGRGIPDMHTMEIALTAYQEVKKAIGAPTIVCQLLHRGWCDVNRGTPYFPLDQAFDQPDGEHAYWTFHHAIQNACLEYKKKGFTPLLIDVHGSANPQLVNHVDAAYGGPTGKNLPGLKKAHGDPNVFMWTGPNAFLTLLDQNGVLVHKGKDVFGGGYTAKHYAAALGVNTIQIEFDKAYRTDIPTAQKAGHGLGQALIKFIQQYPLNTAP